MGSRPWICRSPWSTFQGPDDYLVCEVQHPKRGKTLCTVRVGPRASTPTPTTSLPSLISGSEGSNKAVSTQSSPGPATNHRQTEARTLACSKDPCRECQNHTQAPRLHLLPPTPQGLWLLDKAEFTCLATGEAPLDARFSWEVNGQPHGGALEEGRTRHMNSAWSQSSRLALPKSLWASGSNVTCTLSGPGLQSPVTLMAQREHAASVPGNLTLRTVTAPGPFSPAWLLCEVSGFSPVDILLTWLEGQQEVEPSQFATAHTTAQAGRASSHTWSVLRVSSPLDHAGATYTCVVSHEASRTLLNGSCSLDTGGQVPSGSPWQRAAAFEKFSDESWIHTIAEHNMNSLAENRQTETTMHRCFIIRSHRWSGHLAIVEPGREQRRRHGCGGCQPTLAHLPGPLPHHCGLRRLRHLHQGEVAPESRRRVHTDRTWPPHHPLLPEGRGAHTGPHPAHRGHGAPHSVHHRAQPPDQEEGIMVQRGGPRLALQPQSRWSWLQTPPPQTPPPPCPPSAT